MKKLIAILCVMSSMLLWADVAVRKYKSVAEVSQEVSVREIKADQMPPSEGMYLCAFSIVPALEWPSQWCDVSLLRFNLLVGRHRLECGIPLMRFTERGLYMLATILKGEVATRATISIIETYAQVRSMVNDMEALQSENDGSPGQVKLLTSVGHKFANFIEENLSTQTVETEIDLNLAVMKIRHKIVK